MRYAYVRVSSDKQTTENQRFEITNFCLQRQETIDSWIEETISGTKKVEERLLGDLLQKIQKGDTIIVSELSRLGRNLMQIMGFLNQIMEKEAVVLAVKEKYELGNNINSKVLAFAFSLSAEIERTLISQRTKEALARKKAEGVVLGRPKGSKASRLKLTGKENELDFYKSKNISDSAIGRLLNVNRMTVKAFMKNDR